MNQSQPPRETATAPRLVTGPRLAVAALIALGLGLMASLALEVMRELDALRTASSDTVEWTLTQADVDHRALLLALNDAQRGEPGDLAGLRRRFDIFYSRIATLENGSVYRPLRTVPGYTQRLARVRGFLDGAVPLIDGPETALRAGLDGMVRAVAALEMPVRELTLIGMERFAAQSDARRQDITRLLVYLAATVAAFLLLLAVLSAILWHQRQLSERRARAERRTANQLDAMLRSSLDAIIVTDDRGRVLDFSGSAEQIFDYRRDDVIGREIGGLIVPPHLRAGHAAGMARWQATGSRRVIGRGRVQMEACDRQGRVFPVEMSIQSARTGEEERLVAFIRDVTRRKADEAALIAARDEALAGERAKARFVAVMSHEMRTPLNGIMGMLELLRGTWLDSAQTQYLAAIEESGQLLLGHINSVLDLAAADEGKLRLATVPTDPAALVGRAVAGLQGMAARARVDLRWEWVGPPVESLSTDPERLRQVLLNLLSNALKFTPSGGVTLEMERIGRTADTASLEIRVIDTGIGIAPADLGRVFEDFVTLDAGYSRSRQGTGLGLGITRRIVEALGGEIGVESEPGTGSRFCVRLPLDPVGSPRPSDRIAPDALPARVEVAPTAHEPADAGAPAGCWGLPRLSVLVAEDNEINRHVLAGMLERLGLEAVFAADGAEAVRLAGTRAFDAVLMDISMPVMDGLAATTAIRESDGPSRAAPIIAVTAHALPQEIARFRAVGIQEVLHKPVAGERLAEVLHRLVSPSRPPRTGTGPARLLADLGAGVAGPLIGRFVAEMDDLAEALPRPDAAAGEAGPLLAAVHRCCGAAGALGLGSLAQGLAALEEAGKTSGLAPSTDEIAALRALWASLRGELAALAEQTAGSGTAPPDAAEAPGKAGA